MAKQKRPIEFAFNSKLAKLFTVEPTNGNCFNEYYE